MDSHSAIVRLKEFRIEAHRRKVAQIETMIAEFDRLAAELDREIHAEEIRTGNHDPAHFAYPTYAKATRQRRDNLKRSIADLGSQLEAARQALAAAVEELHMLSPETPRAAAAEGRPAAFDLSRAS
jgi:flagellar export protein FliJ